MIERYTNPRLAEIWSDINKFNRWQESEISYLEAQSDLGLTEPEAVAVIKNALLSNPIDVEEIHRREKVTNHDLNAFMEERRRHIPEEYKRLLHKGNTSYDTEEPAMAQNLRDSCDVVVENVKPLLSSIYEQAHHHRNTVMIARTHGQEAELQSLGKRFLGWLQDLKVDFRFFEYTRTNLDYSKFSGATGNYTTIGPALEDATLRKMGLKPYYGATQIVPREIYAPLAMALVQLCQTIHKIALTIRLSGRSGLPFCHEPFGKGQMGSSAMPHKKNPIITEQLEGMSRLALSCGISLMQNIPTWEERTIEQSCVERVAWPDLFHVTVHSLKRLNKVVSGLVVYPENMLHEIAESGGLYASNEVKTFLKELCVAYGLDDDESYRIAQLAAFNVADAKQRRRDFNRPEDLYSVDELVKGLKKPDTGVSCSFKSLIESGKLKVSDQLEADDATVVRWNSILLDIFSKQENVAEWNKIFQPSYLLRNERFLFEKISA